MHRSYQSNTPTHVYWFDDHIEISNPGGLYGEATPEHLRLQRDSCQESPISDRMTLCFDFDQDQFSYDAVIRRLVDWAMEKSNNNKSTAARLLKTSRKLFY